MNQKSAGRCRQPVELWEEYTFTVVGGHFARRVIRVEEAKILQLASEP